MDIASAPTDVTAFVGRWRVHGLGGAAITPELKESVGIGDVFVVMPVEGTERHAIAMRAPPDAGGAARADSAAAAAPAPAFYICASHERRTTLSFGLKTHEERLKPPSYVFDSLVYEGSGGGDAGAAVAASVLASAPRPPQAIIWRCVRLGESHTVEWRPVDAPLGGETTRPPELSKSLRVEIGAAQPAARKSQQCQCGVFPPCPHAGAGGATGVVWVNADLLTTVWKPEEGEKPSRQTVLCVRRAQAAAATRLLGSTSKTRSLSITVHLPAPVHALVTRSYTAIGPFTQEWMDQHVLADDRQFFDQVDFRGMKAAEMQPALWIPNFDRQEWIVEGANNTPAVAKKSLAFTGALLARARKRGAEEVRTAVDGLSPRQLELFANDGTPPIKVPLFDTEDQLRAQLQRQAAVIAELTAQAKVREEQLRGTEERCAAAERVVLLLTNDKPASTRRWFLETTLHRNKTMSTKYSVQSHFFGIGGTYRGMCDLLGVLFDVQETHSVDDVHAKLTPFEACLIAKSYLFRRTPMSALCTLVREGACCCWWW
jgi:hypothetical protein